MAAAVGASVASSLPDRLRARIGAEGPMPWPAWMEAALYDDEAGYYTRPGRGTGVGSRAGAGGRGPAEPGAAGGRRITGPGDDADFATSPTLHPFFAHCVAHEAAALWDGLGRPPGFAVFEFGGGEGDLARDALAHLDSARPDLVRALRWNHIERSPSHREAQRTGADGRVRWVDDLPPGAVGLVVAHEFVDALPFWWLESTGGGWRGLHVDHDGTGFLLVPGACPPEVAALAPGGVPAGHRVAVMHGARAWLHRVAGRLRAGAVLVVDYGGEGVWRRDRDGTVRTFARHRDAGPAWTGPGEKDVTASVDFGDLRRWAAEAGLVPAWEESQEAFLLRHGVLEALNAIPRDTPEDAGAYLRLRQLLLPTAMGHAFRVALYRQLQTEESSWTSSTSTTPEPPCSAPASSQKAQ